jgi:hypothetical protein
MISKPKLTYNLLQYDIETMHLKARIWRPGEQIVRYDQLLPSANKFRILTISYKWYHEKTTHTLTCGNDGLSEKEMIENFDKEIKKADVVLGKNNNKFDNKMINTIRMIHNIDAMPDWVFKSDDLEVQMRKYFTLPSQGLDYISSIFGTGGKVKMDRSDWISIEDYIEFNKLLKTVKNFKLINYNDYTKFFYGKSYKELKNEGQEAFKKMMFYNKKDVTDTEAALIKILPYITLKHNAATIDKVKKPYACITCGSSAVSPQEASVRGKTRYMKFYCHNHKGYAGSRPFIMDAHSHRKYTSSMGK